MAKSRATTEVSGRNGRPGRGRKVPRDEQADSPFAVAVSHTLGILSLARHCQVRIAIMAPIEVHDDYYAVLEITQTASDDLIKTSYKRLARLRHPDKNAGNPRATAEFQLVSLLLSLLTNSFARIED